MTATTRRRSAGRSHTMLLAAATLVAAGCTTTLAAGRTEPSTTDVPTSTAAPRTAPTTPEPAETTTTVTTDAPAPTTTTTTTPSTTTTAPPPTTTLPPGPVCVGTAQAGESFAEVALRAGVTADPTALWIENGFPAEPVATGAIDLCPENGIDDVTGDDRPWPSSRTIDAEIAANVVRQQERLNELFAGYGIDDLAVDGISGPITGQRLCAARVAFGLPATVDDMSPGGVEQRVVMEASAIGAPPTAPIDRSRWVVIDRTCQIMFIGNGPDLVYVFPTSTGSAGYETRDQDRSQVFRYNPALENGGWHDSTEFPVGVDNPLNGNLYKPLYFDLGQAIHGANYVPTTPESKGCARLRVGDQERLIAFLGLGDVAQETWRTSEIDLVVNVQGAFVGRSG